MFSKVVLSIGSLLFLGLAVSVAYSGYRYTYYGDEVMHVHMMYLLSSEYRIFADFFSIHAPLFHYLLLPFFHISGYTLASFLVLRIVMIVLYMIRLYAGWVLVSKLFSKPVAWLFVVFMLLDPFATFSAMQIRPDNLMMLVFTSALVSLAYAFDRQKKVLWFLSGLLVSLSVLVSMKIAASAVGLVFILTIYLFWKKQWSDLFFFAVGGGVAGILFCLLFVIQGSFFSMLQQLFVDAKAMSDALWYPTRLGFFYLPDNAFIYGLSGTPVPWWIAVSLPIMGVAGLLYAVIRLPKLAVKQCWMIMFFAMLLFQYVFLCTVKSMFVQYYLTVNWILCVFAAFFLSTFFNSFKKPGIRIVFSVFGIIVFGYVVGESVRANIIRPTTVSSIADSQKMNTRWDIIPDTAAVYPVLLFRPLSQPIPYGYFIPEVPRSIRSRYPTALNTISHVDYLIMDEYFLRFLDADATDYVSKHFHQTDIDTDVWVRNNPNQ